MQSSTATKSPEAHSLIRVPVLPLSSLIVRRGQDLLSFCHEPIWIATLAAKDNLSNRKYVSIKKGLFSVIHCQ